MSHLITSSGKGAPLTPAEADGNLLEIDRRTGDGWFDTPMEITVPVGAVDIPTWKEFEDGFGLYAFEPGFLNAVRADIHLNHDYKPATMIYPHTHWTTNQNFAGTVRFGFTWKYARRADSPSGVVRFTAAQTIYVEASVALGQTGYHFVSEPTDGDGIYHPDFEVDGMVMCRFFRDGGHPNDTFAGDVFLIKADAHCETDTLATPLRFPPFRT
jgi:hypothetical protein